PSQNIEEPKFDRRLDMPEHKTLSPTLKPPEFKRDRMGRFERPGATLKKVQKTGHRFKKGQAPGPGRPKGSKSKTTLALKEAILPAVDRVGGEQYLAMRSIQNGSAFSSLLGKPPPHSLAPASVSDGGGKITFERIVCWPREVEGVTPKALPTPPDE